MPGDSTTVSGCAANSPKVLDNLSQARLTLIKTLLLLKSLSYNEIHDNWLIIIFLVTIKVKKQQRNRLYFFARLQASIEKWLPVHDDAVHLQIILQFLMTAVKDWSINSILIRTIMELGHVYL